MRQNVIGLCRFSYPAEGGFQVEHETLDDRISFLYAPERMEERFATFECLTLPALRAQTDPDFTFIVLVGDSLPLPYRTRLGALIETVPQAVLISRPPGPHRKVMQEVINSVKDPAAEMSLQFRLDDDDAVGVDFVRALRAKAAENAGLLQDNRHFAVDFTQGYVARCDGAGIYASPTQENLWTAGLAVVFRPQVGITVMNFGHNRLGRFMPIVRVDSPAMFVRGHNAYNDSRHGKSLDPVPLRPLDAAGTAVFKDTFAIDADHVRRVFG